MLFIILLVILFILEDLVIHEFRKLNTFNILLKRTTKYQEEGRYHKENEALDLDLQIKVLLDTYGIRYHECTVEDADSFILEKVLDKDVKTLQ